MDDEGHGQDVRAFFAGRAATWDDKFPEDEPRYRRAVADLGPEPGAWVLDVGCGTGRAFEALRHAVGPAGVVVGVDPTVEMLRAAQQRGRDGFGALVRADALAIPFADDSFDAVFEAGVIHHLSDPVAGVRELARVSRPGARLAAFHPISRAQLAAKHGHDTPSPRLPPDQLPELLAHSGWQVITAEDGPARYLTIASRR